MKFYSTKNRSYQASFEEAVRMGLAPDGGLFMPERIHSLPDSFWRNFSGKNFVELSFDVAHNFLQGALGEPELKKIVEHTLEFDAPLVQIDDITYSLELFHGPTLAFKDFGARFLSGVLGLFAEEGSKEITILVATSGDTGSAVAHGFFKVPGTKVIVLYPSGKVSDIQEKQFTTLGENITALEIDGTFDDCQRMIKQAFGDKEINAKRILTSANSINIARLLPQMFYYFRAIQQLKLEQRESAVISVPSGNFGNLTAGLLARRMGLPIKRFIAATNVNDVVPVYLRTGLFEAKPSRATISNAMDVGNPSNFNRMLELYQNDWKALATDVSGCIVSDTETKATMRSVFKKECYTLDPHGAVAYCGLKSSLKAGEIGIFLETAHAAKFSDVVEAVIGSPVSVPDRLLNYLSGQKQSIRITKGFEELKDYLITN